MRCLLLAGVGHEAVVGVWPACWGNDEIPLPGDETPPDNDDRPEFGSGFNFLNAPSATSKQQQNLIFFKLHWKYDDEKKLNWSIYSSIFYFNGYCGCSLA